MAIRFMLDTDNLNDLTGHAKLLATYADLVTDLPALQAKFPNSVIILIDRGLGDHTGQASVFDIERGALTIPQAVQAYDRQHARGVRELTVYCSRDNLATVNAAFGARSVYRWIATLDGTVHIAGFKALEGPAVVQCLSAAMLGYHADGSLVLQDGWHRTTDLASTAPLQADIADAKLHLAAVATDLAKLTAAIGG